MASSSFLEALLEEEYFGNRSKNSESESDSNGESGVDDLVNL